MKDETKVWFSYADENLQSAKILFDQNLFNPLGSALPYFDLNAEICHRCLKLAEQVAEQTYQQVAV